MLHAQPKRTCVPVPGFNICADNQTGNAVELPERGAAIVMSSDDWGVMATELETACRLLKKVCSYQTMRAIIKMKEKNL